MNVPFSDVMLYLAGVFLIQSLLLGLLRKIKVPDFITYLTTGILLGALMWGWNGATPDASAHPFSQEYRVTDEVREILTGTVSNPEIVARLDSLNLPPLDAGTFLQQMETILPPEQLAFLSPALLRAAEIPPGNPAHILLRFLSTVGLLLFFMHLGIHFDFRFLQLIRDQRFLIQTALIVVPLAGGLFLGAYFLLFDSGLRPALLWLIAGLSVNIGAFLAVAFPVRPALKNSVSRLILLAVVLDALAVAGYAWALLLDQYQLQPEQIRADAPFWVLLCLFAAVMGWPKLIGPFRRRLREAGGEFTILLRFALILLFIYAGLRINFPLLLLGLGAGILFQTLFDEAEFSLRRRFLSGAAFFYILPFAAAGQAMLGPLLWEPQTWIVTGWMLAVFAVVALAVGLAWIWQKENPWVMALGVFPRGEVALLIMWMFLQQHLISPRIFISTALAIILSTLLGRILSAALFGKGRSPQKRLKIS